MTVLAAAETTFDQNAQLRFAAFSGDRNPLHLDAIAARRSPLGAPVVHGVHALLWCLDAVAVREARPASIDVRFAKPLYVGERARAELVASDASGWHATVRAGGGEPALEVVAKRGDVAPQEACAGDGETFAPGEPSQPLERPFEAFAHAHGTVAFDPGDGGFAGASLLLGGDRVAALGAMTRLVGMIVPGRHSLFSRLRVRATDGGGAALAFAVERADPRLRLVRTHVSGGGWDGVLESLSPEPVAQPSFDDIARRVPRGRFAGVRAYVAGGSRGLGETTAKMLAAGGADVVLTYARGRDDAERVAAEIRAGGGAVRVAHFDANDPRADGIPAGITHLYYFASPHIARRDGTGYDAAAYARLRRSYVDGFRALSDALLAATDRLVAFYPSTVFVEDAPAGLAEYAAAKADGEALCAALASERLSCVVRRLPRVATDQNVTVVPVRTVAAFDVMLPILDEVHPR